MKFNKEIRELLECRFQGLTLAEVIILKMLRKRPLYLVELCEAMNADPGTLRKMVLRLQDKGLVVKEKVPAHSGIQGPPLSARISLVE